MSTDLRPKGDPARSAGAAPGYRPSATLPVMAEIRRQASRRRTQLALGFMVLGFVLVFVIWRVALRREQRIIAQYLADEVPRGVLTPAEFAILTDDKARRRALKAARKHGGKRLKRLQQAFFQASAELAFRKYHLANGDRPKSGQARTPEDEYRTEIQQLRGSLTEQGTGG